MSFAIGQIIYVLSDKTTTVLPGIIEEEIHYRSVEGEKISYKVAIGPANKKRVVDLSSVDGEVFGDLSEIRERLVTRLTAWVDGLCETTADRVRMWYGAVPGGGQTTVQPGEKIDPSVFMNELNAQQQPQQFARQPTTSLNNLQTAMADPDLLTREYVAEDGTIRKIPV